MTRPHVIRRVTPSLHDRQLGAPLVRAAFPAIYDFVMELAERWRVGRWRRDVVEPAGGAILEIAAGTGLNFRHYRPDARVVATEPDLAMLARARIRIAESPATIMLVAADAEALPFRPGAFDTAVVALAMCTIPTPDLALAEIRRVLRPGGVLRMLEHVRVDHPVTGSIQDWLTPVWRRVAGGCRLNRRTVPLVVGGGFMLDAVEREMGGAVVKIQAHAP